MKIVFPDKIRTSVVTRVVELFILVAAAIAFFATPMFSFAMGNLATCTGGPPPGTTPIPQPTATFVAAFTIKAGTKTTKVPTLTPDASFKPTLTQLRTLKAEIIEIKFNNQIVFAWYEGHGHVMTGKGDYLKLVDANGKPLLPADAPPATS